MKKQLTEIQAIKESMDLWEFLKDNPTCVKTDHKSFNSIYHFYENNCPLCAYYFDEENNNCGKCFLQDNNTAEDKICCKEFYDWAGTNDCHTWKWVGSEQIVKLEKARVNSATFIYEKIKAEYIKLYIKEIKMNEEKVVTLIKQLKEDVS